MPIKLGTKVILKPYRAQHLTIYGVVVDVSVKHDPPRYDVRCTNGMYSRGMKEEELEVVGGGPDAVAGDDKGRVSKSA